MAWKKSSLPEPGTKEHHLSNIKMVVSRHPNWSTTTRWSVETAFLDAAYLYDNAIMESGMPDHVWEALANHLMKTWGKRSPYFKGCVDRKAMVRKATNLAIYWDGPLGRAIADFWDETTVEPAPAPKPKLKLRKIVKGAAKVRKLRLVRSI